MSPEAVAERAGSLIRQLGGRPARAPQAAPAARPRPAPEPTPEALPAPAPALVEAPPPAAEAPEVPAEVPVETPETPAETPEAPALPRRNFNEAREVVWHSDGRRFVLREYVDGAHVYHAFERSDALFYGVEAADLGLDVGRPHGRIDTRRSLRSFDPVRDYDALVDHRRSCYREALELIHEVCPETASTGRLGEPGNAVFSGPGRVVLLARPETRYRAALAARRPE